MASLWGAEVKPGKPYNHAYSPRRGRLRLTQATLEVAEDAEYGNTEMRDNWVQVQCVLKNKEPVVVCNLVPGKSEGRHLELEFEEDVTFSVLGPMGVNLAGYYMGKIKDDEDGVSNRKKTPQETNVQKETTEEYERASLADNVHEKRKKKEKRRKVTNPFEDDSCKQVVEKTEVTNQVHTDVMESDTKDKPLQTDLNKDKRRKKRKRKNSALSDDFGSSSFREVEVENEVFSVTAERKEDGAFDAKQKKMKREITDADEAHTDQQADNKNCTAAAAEELTGHDDTNEDPSQMDLVVSDHEDCFTSKTIASGEPGGRKASTGSTVYIRYIGKLKDGTIFGSTSGLEPVVFTLGVGEVIKGWDIGIDGMCVGEERHLTIPPSLAFGNQKMGSVPPNSTLEFELELVGVED